MTILRYFGGKALANYEPVLTSGGYKPISAIKLGDTVYGRDGNPCSVIGVFPQGIKDLYRVTFSDDVYVDCCGEHLWTIVNNWSPQNSGRRGDLDILSINDMLHRRPFSDNLIGSRRWITPKCEPIKFKYRKVDLDPYTLGLILGDGHVSKNGSCSITTADPEILDYIPYKISNRKAPLSYGILDIYEKTRKIGLSIFRTCKVKRVPYIYKYNSVEIRKSVLAGLLDTDGSIYGKYGRIEYSSISKQLAEDVVFLVKSLGGKATINESIGKYSNKVGDIVECEKVFRVNISTNFCPFKLTRKAAKWTHRLKFSYNNLISSITPIGSHEATCIAVDSIDNTFIIKDFKVTHNSQMYNKIIPYIPEHKLFRSVFLGAGGIEFKLDPIGKSEIWNDIDSDLMNFYNVLQTEALFKDFQRVIDLTPFSEDTFNTHQMLNAAPLEYFGASVPRAVSFFITNRMSRGGDGKDFCTSTTRLRRDINENVSAYLSAVDGLPEFHNRIKYVEIRNMDFREFIPKFDHEDAFFLCDPTYLQETRVAGGYTHEMTDLDHEDLLDILKGIDGKFLLHGYESDLYKQHEKANNWNRVEFDVTKSSSSSKIKPKTTEIIWMNY